MVHCVFHATYKYCSKIFLVPSSNICEPKNVLLLVQCIAPGHTCTKCVLSMEDPSPPLSLQKVYLVKMTSGAWLLQFQGSLNKWLV